MNSRDTESHREGAEGHRGFLGSIPDTVILRGAMTGGWYSLLKGNMWRGPLRHEWTGLLDARMAAARRRVIPNDWYALADPRLYPSVGLGYRFGRMPQIVSVADERVGLLLS